MFEMLLSPNTTSKRLTVLQVLPELESGGVERGTLEVGAELVRRGHRSLVASGGGRMVEQLEREGSEHFSAPIGKKSPFTLRWIGWMRRLMLEQQVDVVHVRSRVPAWVVWYAWRGIPESSRPRLVTTVHGRYLVSRFSRIMTRGEAVIAVSRTIRDYIRSSYPETPDETLRLIFRGVDPLEFERGFRPSPEWEATFFEQHPQARGRQLLTLPGRVTRLKGHSDFLTLIAELRSQGRPVHGLIVGGVDPRKRRYGDEVRKLVDELGLQNDVTFVGHRSDMKEVYAISSLVLSLSSKPESFGRTVLEALNLGTPVAGYSHGGVGEILNDLFPAGAVPVGDVETLCRVVAGLFDTAAVVPPVERYRLSEMLDQTISLYADLTAEKARELRAVA